MASKKCAICSEQIVEEYGKLKGTVVRKLDENKKTELIYVCSNCQKDKEFLTKVK
jgi:hypothetical protein